MNVSGTALANVSVRTPSRSGSRLSALLHAKKGSGGGSEDGDATNDDLPVITRFKEQESLRSMVATAAVSIFGRLMLLRGVVHGRADDAVEDALLDAIQEVEQTLQEMLSHVPEDRSGATPAAAEASPEDGCQGQEKQSPVAEPVVDVRGPRDVDELQRQVALLRQRLLDDQIAEAQLSNERQVAEQSLRRRVAQLEDINHSLQRDVVALQGPEGAVGIHATFLSLDVAEALTSGYTEKEFQGNVLQLLELLGDRRVLEAAGDDRFKRTFDRVRELEREVRRANDRMTIMKRRTAEERRKMQAERATQERKVKEFKNRIEDMERTLAKDKSMWSKMEAELSTLRADKEAMIQNVELAEEKIRSERQKFFVKIAEVTMKAHLEQMRREVDFELLPDPENVDLAKQIASSGIAVDVSDATLERILAVTSRPDDPARLASADYLVDRVEYLTKEVRVLGSLAKASFEAEVIGRAQLLDAKEDVQRVTTYCRDMNCPIPSDLTRTRSDNEALALYNIDSNPKELARVLRLDMRVATKRLSVASRRLRAIEDAIVEAFDGDAAAAGVMTEHRGGGPTPNLEARAQARRGTTTTVAAAAQQFSLVPVDMGGADGDDGGDGFEVGTMLDEVARVERIENELRGRIVEGSRTIRRLAIERDSAIKSRAAERLTWTKHWMQLMDVLPYSVAGNVNLDGLQTLEHPSDVNAIQEAHKKHLAALEAERKALLAEVEAAKQLSLQSVHDAEAAMKDKIAGLQQQAAQLAATVAKAAPPPPPPKSPEGDDRPPAKKNPTTDHMTQTNPPPKHVDHWTAIDRDLLIRQGEERGVNTEPKQQDERGIQAHVLGVDKSAEADLEPPKPPFDEAAAQAMFHNIHALIRNTAETQKNSSSEGSRIPRRIVCPKCGDSISVFRPAPNQPEKAAQTEALPEPRTASVGRRSVQKRKEKCNEARVERIYIAVVAAAPGYSIPRSEVLENCLPLFTAESQSANEWVCSSDDVAGAAAAVFQLRQSAELSRSTYVGACVTSDERLTATAFCTGLARSSTSGRQIMCNKRLAELLQVDASSACVASIRPVKPQTLNGRLAYKVQLVKTTKMPKLMKEDDGADGAFLTSTPDETHDGQDGGAIEAVDSDDDADGEEPILALEEDSPSQLGANEAEEDDEEFPVMMTDAEAQCTDVVILSNDEFNSLKRGTPTAPPLRPYSGSSSHGIPKKVEKGLPPSRPSTASMQRITASLGYELPNRDYEGAVMRLCWALHRSHQADDSTIMLSRQGDLTTPRLLIQLAALCNVRFLLGLRESDQEQQLKLQAVSALSSLLSIFGCTDSATLPSPVPYFVVSDWRPEMASAAPPATAISDAFAPLISAIADACQNNSRSRPKKHAAADLEALMGKVTELDEMLRAATRRAGIAGAPPPATKALTLAPDSKDLPPLARARLPSMIDDGVDSDGDPEHEGLDNGRARRLIQRVLVKPLARTASIRKTITLDQKKVSQEVDAPSVMRTPPQPLRPLQAAQRRDDAAEAIVRRSNSPPLSQAKKRGLQPLGGSSSGMAPWAQGQGLTSPLSPGLLSTPVLTGITEAFVERFGNSPRSL